MVLFSGALDFMSIPFIDDVVLHGIENDKTYAWWWFAAVFMVR